MRNFIKVSLLAVLCLTLGFLLAANLGAHFTQPAGVSIECTNSVNGQVLYKGLMVGRPLFLIKSLDIVVQTDDGIMALFTTGVYTCVIISVGHPVETPQTKEGV